MKLFVICVETNFSISITLKLMLCFLKSSSKKFIKLVNLDLSSVTIKIFLLFKYWFIQNLTNILILLLLSKLGSLGINKGFEYKFITFLVLLSK